MEDILTGFDVSREQPSIIKVIGVGGGGGNAVTHMYQTGISDVTFALCNTDNQALIKSEVPVKIQLGRDITHGLGAGNDPVKAQKAALASADEIRNLLDDGTQMVFITAGMGGGTGTGAAPVIAGIAKEMGLLTVGIVTIPFLFEMEDKIIQALRGVQEMRKNVDALLVINNQRLIDIYGDLTFTEAFAKANSTLTNSAKSISEIITIPGIVNLDFADVEKTLKNGGVAIMNSGYGEGENRVLQAFKNALNSPLLNNNNAFKAQKILFNIYSGNENQMKASEMAEAEDFLKQFKSRNIKLIYGTALDDTLEGEQIKVTLLASGFNVENLDPKMSEIIQENPLTEEESVQMAGLMDDFYGPGVAKRLRNGEPPKPFIFKSVEQLTDDKIIEATINRPAYKRNLKEIENLIAE